jgi:hypothetical protein
MINVARCVSVFAAVPLAYAAWGTQGAIWAIALHGLAMVPFVHGYNVRLGLHDTRRELLVLAALPGGLAVGYALRSLLGG